MLRKGKPFRVVAQWYEHRVSVAAARKSGRKDSIRLFSKFLTEDNFFKKIVVILKNEKRHFVARFMTNKMVFFTFENARFF
jgi:hypothetical protein